MGGSEAATAAANRYFAVRMWSAPFALANYVLLGWFVGQARMRTALSLQLAINFTNILATIVPRHRARLRHRRRGAAAIIAEATGALFGFIAARKLFRGGLSGFRRVVFDRARVLRLISVNRDIMIRTASLIAAFFFFTAQGARAGEVTLAANAVLNNFMMIGLFSSTASPMRPSNSAAAAWAAATAIAFRKAARLVSGWSFGFGVAISSIFFVFGSGLIDVMTSNVEVRATARAFLPYAALAPTCAVMAYCFDGIYIGATWARDMRNLMIAALATYLAAWYLLQGFGNTGLWISFLIFQMSRGLYQGARFPTLARRSFKTRGPHETAICRLR